jgi:ribosome maturation factor RimP
MDRTAVETALESIAEPVCRAHGVELVQLRLMSQGGRSIVQILIDRDAPGRGPDGSGVTLEDCTAVSRDVSTALDVHEDVVPGAYDLEVSSPGLDRPLTRLAHFDRFAGRLAKVELAMGVEGRRRFKGKILGTAPGVVRLEQDGAEVALPFDDIERARLVYEPSTRKPK